MLMKCWWCWAKKAMIMIDSSFSVHHLSRAPLAWESRWRCQLKLIILGQATRTSELVLLINVKSLESLLAIMFTIFISYWFYTCRQMVWSNGGKLLHITVIAFFTYIHTSLLLSISQFTKFPLVSQANEAQGANPCDLWLICKNWTLHLKIVLEGDLWILPNVGFWSAEKNSGQQTSRDFCETGLSNFFHFQFKSRNTIEETDLLFMLAKSSDGFGRKQ